MLEAARKGEALAPQLASKLFTGEGSGSQPNHPSKVTEQDLGPVDLSMSFSRQRSKTPLFAGLAVGFLALALGGYFLVRPEPRPSPPPARPTPLRSSLAVECTPPAEVWVDDGPEGLTPQTVQLWPGEHQVVLRAKGYVEQRRTVKAGDGGEKLQLVVTLEKEPVAAPVAAVDAGVARPPVKVARSTGKLNLRTTPWTTVYLGKRKLGDTPLVGVVLPSGSQVLRVVNAEAGVRSSIEVTIQPNATTSENLVLK